MATKEQNENQQWQEKLAQANEPKTRCLICKFETSPKMRCICVAGGDELAKEIMQNDQPTRSEDVISAKHIESKQEQENEPEKIKEDKNQKNKSSENLFIDLSFDLTIIQDLIRRNLLQINNHSELGVFTIQCDKIHSLNPQEKIELQKFMQATLQLHKTFLQEKLLQPNNLPLQFEQDYDKNIKLIKISTLNPALYDAFIQKLKLAKILNSPAYGPIVPTPNDNQPSLNQKRSFHPTPFKTAPKPKGYQE